MAFATDLTLSAPDLEMLRRAVRGEKQALIGVCRRFKVPVLAAAIQAGGDLEAACACVEALLGALCRDLLSQRFPIERFAEQVVAIAAQHFETENRLPTSSLSPASTLSSLASIPRLARRRTVATNLRRLPLPELTALLLQYIDGAPPRAMLGLVAESEQEVREKLASAHEMISQELPQGPQ